MVFQSLTMGTGTTGSLTYCLIPDLSGRSILHAMMLPSFYSRAQRWSTSSSNYSSYSPRLSRVSSMIYMKIGSSKSGGRIPAFYRTINVSNPKTPSFQHLPVNSILRSNSWTSETQELALGSLGVVMVPQRSSAGSARNQFSHTKKNQDY